MGRTAVPGSSALPVFSDLHLRAESIETAIRVLAGMRTDALAMGAREVGFTGDFYHVRGLMPLSVQNAVLDELDEWRRAGLTLILIPGNHDIYDVAGRHALEVLRTHPSVRLYDRPTVDRWGLWIPFLPQIEDVRRVLADHRGRASVVFWHGPMRGARMNDHVLSDAGLDVDDLAGYDLACLGHFHARQTIGPATYVGSPWETRADEAGHPKGYAVVRARRMEYRDRAWGPRHLRVRGSTTAEVVSSLEGAGAEDVVRVVVPEALVQEVSAALAGRYADYVVTPERAEVVSVRALPDQPMSLREHAERLVSERAGDLSVSALMGTYDSIVG